LQLHLTRNLDGSEPTVIKLRLENTAAFSFIKREGPQLPVFATQKNLSCDGSRSSFGTSLTGPE
ncbi:MAG: hypothetical protein ABSG91_25210, partial [Syntrophobacteraceae bacterium]